MAYRYKPNKYNIYDDALTFEENYQNDAVITKKKLDRLEEQVKFNSADWAIGQVKYVDKIEDADFSLDFNELEGTHRINMTIPTRGKSAYQSWLDLGNVGTEEDFIKDLKGDTYQHRVFLNKLVLENIHGNDEEYSSICEYFEDEARIYVDHNTDMIGGNPPQFNARFYGPNEAASAKIAYSTDLTYSEYTSVTVSRDYDNCAYIGRRIDAGEIVDDVWEFNGDNANTSKYYWKVLWYDKDGKMIGADRIKISFVNSVAGLFSENDSDSTVLLKKEFTTMLNDAVADLRAELEAKIDELDTRTKLKTV